MDLSFLEPRQTRQSTIYKDLSKENITVMQKQFIAEMLLGRHEDSMGPAPPVATFARRHNLDRSTVHGWMDRVKNKQILHERSGCSPRLDQEAKESLKEAISKARDDKKPVSKSELETLVVQEANNTRIRRNQAPTSEIPKRTLQYIKKDINITKKKP